MASCVTKVTKRRLRSKDQSTKLRREEPFISLSVMTPDRKDSFS